MNLGTVSGQRFRWVTNGGQDDTSSWDWYSSLSVGSVEEGCGFPVRRSRRGLPPSSFGVGGGVTEGPTRRCLSCFFPTEVGGRSPGGPQTRGHMGGRRTGFPTFGDFRQFLYESRVSCSPSSPSLLPRSDLESNRRFLESRVGNWAGPGPRVVRRPGGPNVSSSSLWSPVLPGSTSWSSPWFPCVGDRTEVPGWEVGLPTKTDVSVPTRA